MWWKYKYKLTDKSVWVGKSDFNTASNAIRAGLNGANFKLEEVNRLTPNKIAVEYVHVSQSESQSR